MIPNGEEVAAGFVVDLDSEPFLPVAVVTELSIECLLDSKFGLLAYVQFDLRIAVLYSATQTMDTFPHHDKRQREH